MKHESEHVSPVDGELRVWYGKMRDALRCHRAYQFRYHEWLTVPPTDSMRVGRTVHQALARLLRGEDVSRSLEELETPELQEYATTLLDHARPKYEALKIRHAETLFEFHDETARVTHLIKPDGVVEREDGTWVLEIKSTSRYSTKIARLYHYDPQPWYYAAIYEQYTGKPVKGVLMLVTTPKEAFLEPIFFTQGERSIALDVKRHGVRAVKAAEVAIQTGAPLVDRTECVSYVRECHYLPLCSAMNQAHEPAVQNYLDELKRSLYITEDPEAHLHVD